MFIFSATDRAIQTASATCALRLVERVGRFGGFVSIEDAAGVIEVQNTMAEAVARVTACGA